MLFIKTTLKSISLLAMASFILFIGCNENEVTPKSQTDLLVGDWILAESAGIEYDYTVDSEFYTWKFKSSGAWQTCFDYRNTPQDNWCNDGNWAWEDSEETIFVINGGQRVKIDILNETRLEGINGYQSFSQVIKFVRAR